MKLSENFSLGEFLVSQTAERHGIDMTPPEHVIENLTELCVEVLQPIRDGLNSPIVISSGYRPRRLNTLIKGSKTSQHCFGRAADFSVIGMTPFAVCQEISLFSLSYDQLICEFNRWVHIGIAKEPRGQHLTATRQDGEVVYLPGLLREEELA